MKDKKVVHEADTESSDGKKSGDVPVSTASTERGAIEYSGDAHLHAQMDAQVGADEKVTNDKMAQHCDEHDKGEREPLTPTQQENAAAPSRVCLQKNLQVYEVTLRKDVYGLGIYFMDAHGSAIVDPKLPFYRLPNEVVAPGEASRLIMPGDVLRAINGRVLQGLSFASVVEELRRISIGDVTLAFERPFPLVTLVLQSDQDNEPSRQRQSSNQENDRDLDQGQDNSELDVENNQLENDASEESDEKRAKRWSVFQRLSSTAASITGAAGASSIAALEIAALEDLLSEMEAKLQSTEESLGREKKCRFLAEKKNILYRTELLRLSEENSLLRYKLAKEKSSRAQKDEFCQNQLHLAI